MGGPGLLSIKTKPKKDALLTNKNKKARKCAGEKKWFGFYEVDSH
jgi:hypothetical protein